MMSLLAYDENEYFGMYLEEFQIKGGGEIWMGGG
jgi:hypothetical protein